MCAELVTPTVMSQRDIPRDTQWFNKPVGRNHMVMIREVERYVSPCGQKFRKGLFICPSCSREFECRINNVISGSTSQCKSCGDADIAKATRSPERRAMQSKVGRARAKNGGRMKSPWYQSWRCRNNLAKGNCKGYEHVGICWDWDRDNPQGWVNFRDFCLTNFGKAPKRDLNGDVWHIDRIDPKGDYEPSNVQLVPKQVNLSKPATDAVGGRTSVTPLDCFGYHWVETTVGYGDLCDYIDNKLN